MFVAKCNPKAHYLAPKKQMGVGHSYGIRQTQKWVDKFKSENSIRWGQLV